MPYSLDNSVNGKALKTFLNYAVQHQLKFRKLKSLNLEGNLLSDMDIAQFCKAVRKGAYKNLDTLSLKGNGDGCD